MNTCTAKTKNTKYGKLYKPVLNGNEVSAVLTRTKKEALHIAENIAKYPLQKAITQAVSVAKDQIKLNKGYRMTNYMIRRNIELVQGNPEKFGAQFCKMYQKATI